MELDPKKYNRIDYQKAPKILEVKDLRVSFKSDSGIVHAVRGVSFDLYKGETLCIVGESGCGKSATCKTLMGILANEAVIEGGTAMFEGEDLTRISEEDFHRIRGNKIGMIFQDPLSSLNPIMKIGQQITEATLINRNILKKRYNDLISKELIAFKNLQTERNYAIQQLVAQYDFYEVDAKKKLSDAVYQMKKAGKPQSEILAFERREKRHIRKEYRTIRKANRLKTRQIEKDYRLKAPALKAALTLRKKEAKQENKVYADKLKKELQEAVSKIDVELKTLTPEKNQARIQELQAQRAKLINDYQLKTCITKKQAKAMALEVMKEVGIPQPEARFKQYPFEFSGGMRQRIVIAIALTANPEVLICDEPTTALDVTIQAQILELINKIKKDRNMSVIFITHDLGVVANMADRVAVMYAGKIVEVGTAFEVFFQPKHPYTWALLSSVPDVDSKEKLVAIPGTPPNLVTPPKGDAFAARNQYAMAVDYEYEPPLFKISETHYASTWLLYEKFAPKAVPPKIVTTRIEKALEEEEAYERHNG
ncbi:MAG: ATP-binding cassette domain-containing protein [Bacilli bacterium]|jgi:oligopeptide transport system ATP-binding protein|nr:ATP-binding cassette domain-containing protein [Bacilli bacterium]